MSLDSVRHNLWPYSGSKWRMCQRLHALFPPHKRFVDVFGGTGTVLARKDPSTEEVYCDVDCYCRNALTVVKHEGGCEALVRRLKNTRRDREQIFLLQTPASESASRCHYASLGFPGLRGSRLPRASRHPK